MTGAPPQSGRVPERSSRSPASSSASWRRCPALRGSGSTHAAGAVGLAVGGLGCGQGVEDGFPDRTQFRGEPPVRAAGAVAVVAQPEITPALLVLLARRDTVLVDAGQQHQPGLGDLTGMQMTSLLDQGRLDQPAELRGQMRGDRLDRFHDHRGVLGRDLARHAARRRSPAGSAPAPPRMRAPAAARGHGPAPPGLSPRPGEIRNSSTSRLAGLVAP